MWERAGPRWEVCLTLSDGTFNQVSFVNAICTTHGGQHVTAIADQIAEAVVAAATKKAGGAKAGLEIKAAHVKNYMTLFVNAQIENPAFDSQARRGGGGGGMGALIGLRLCPHHAVRPHHILCPPTLARLQTKETLTTRAKDFGSSPVLSDRFLKEVCATGIADRVLAFARYKATAELQVCVCASSGGKRHGRAGALRAVAVCCAASAAPPPPTH